MIMIDSIIINRIQLKGSNYFRKITASFSQVQEQSSEGHNLLNHQLHFVFTERRKKIDDRNRVEAR